MLTKMVDGVEVVMSAEEEAAIRAEWEANAQNLAREKTPEEKLESLGLTLGDLKVLLASVK